MLHSSLWSLLTTLSLALSGCAGVTINDYPIYADKGSLGAAEAHTIDDVPVEQVPKIQWDDMRFGMLCMGADAWADYKKDVEKVCATSHLCTEQLQTSTANISKLIVPSPTPAGTNTLQ